MSQVGNYQTSSWEVQDPGQKSTLTMKAQEINAQLASGNLGMYAKVKRVGESQWMSISQVAEFHAVCPFINSQYCTNPKIGSLNGSVTISNDLQKLVSESARVRASPGFYDKVGFHAPILDTQFLGLVRTSGRIFRLWDNFWVGALLTPPQASIADVNSSFLMYLFALNTFTSSQVHKLHPYDYPIPDEEIDNLTLAVPAGGLSFNRVRIPVSKQKGVGIHTLTFRTVTGSQKLAKGALIGAITLGSVVYKQGHKGFTVTLRVVPATVAVSPTSPSPRPISSPLYCWCGHAVKGSNCEGCSSPPYICECNDGHATKVSQQFSKLPRLVQERLRKLDLTPIWQKTPAELTAEDRFYFGARGANQPQRVNVLSEQTQQGPLSCPKCSQPTHPGQRFCAECGNSLTFPTLAPEPTPVQGAASPIQVASSLNLKELTGFSSQQWEWLLSLPYEADQQNTVIGTSGFQEPPFSPSEFEDLGGMIAPTAGPSRFFLTENGTEVLFNLLLELPNPILLGREKAIAGREPYMVVRQLVGPGALLYSGVTSDSKLLEWLKERKEGKKE